MALRRPLHWVFKNGNRRGTMGFYKDVLGMKVLRHEEFVEGCKATCNGPYDGKWSKTMVGYGPEDENFVVELTYNYGVSDYRHGNDFGGLVIHSSNAFKNCKEEPDRDCLDTKTMKDPDGYTFYVKNSKSAASDSQIAGVVLNVSNFDECVKFWKEVGKCVGQVENGRAILSFPGFNFHLELVKTTGDIDHGKGFGRLAIACDTGELQSIQNAVIAYKSCKILTELVKLDTPGKASVQVVIVADPSGNEVCFVGDAEFRHLSKVDPNADAELEQHIASDKSSEWFSKPGRAKKELL